MIRCCETAVAVTLQLSRKYKAVCPKSEHPSKDKWFATTVPNNRPEAEPALQAHLLLDLPACAKNDKVARDHAQTSTQPGLLAGAAEAA